MTKVQFAELHSPMFFCGINLGNKLDTSKRSELSLIYDNAACELLVTMFGKTTHVPASSLVHYTPGIAEAPKIVNQHKPQRVPVNAQVSDPSRDVQNPRK